MEFEVGKTVYFEESWSGNVIEAVVTDVAPVRIACKHVVDTNGKHIDKAYGSQLLNPKNVYATAKEAYAVKRAKYEELVDKYYSEITDIKSLVEFPLRNSFGAEEYIDYAAIEAYKKSVKRILGYDVSHIEY